MHEMYLLKTPFNPKRKNDMTELFTNIANVKVLLFYVMNLSNFVCSGVVCLYLLPSMQKMAHPSHDH